MRKTVYIGEFPPPFGGVTVKNALLRNEVYNECNGEFFNLYDCKKNPLKLFKMIKLIWFAKRKKAALVLGIAYNIRLEIALKMIRLIGGKKLVNRCVIFMMGSSLPGYCMDKPRYVKLLNQVKCILTESHKLEEELDDVGIRKVSFFPNCRLIKEEFLPKKRNTKEPLRMVFFSKICIGKGVTTLFQVVNQLEKSDISFQIDFYGVIDSDFKEEFEKAIEMHESCQYKGVFDAVNDNVCQKLHEYDLLLFPTEWKSEGVAGILVESKIAGIPAIVTNHKYNSEVVIDGTEGIVVEKDYASGFYNAISKVYDDSELLFQLAVGAAESKKRYDILTYRDILLDYISE